MEQPLIQPIAQNEQRLQQQLPPGYSLRAPTLDDVPATVVMLNASSLATLGTPCITEEEFRADWQEPGFNLATDSRVVTAPDGQLVGIMDAVMQPPYVRNFIWGRVHPQHCGLGIGTVLTTWAETRVTERIIDAPTDARVIARCQNSHIDHDAFELLTQLGYAHVRTTYAMKIELVEGPPPPIWPAGITIRTMIPNQEEAAVYRAKEEAFYDHWGHIEAPFTEGFALWQHHLHNNPNYDPSLFFVAMEGETIAGYALCEPTIADYPDMAWVDNLGVRRPWRRRGLALALLYHLFGEFYQRGFKHVGLGVDADSLTGATRLYEKAGMQVFRQYNTYVKELRPGRDLTRQ